MRKLRLAGISRLFLLTFVCFLFLGTQMVCAAAKYSPGKIIGKVTDKKNKPLAGVLVSAYDSDSGRKDEFIGRDKTDSNGKYEIRIPKRSKKNQWDGPKTKRHTQWRPDIYILVEKAEYKRTKSKTYSDHKLKNNRTINVAMKYLPGGRTVSGVIFQGTSKTPLAGALVTACDSDPGEDQKMGTATTNSAGRYKLSYRAGSWDGPKTDKHTQWRPDIFVVVTKDGWKRTKSPTRTNQRLAVPLTVNVKVPPKPGKKHMITNDMCKTESPAARCKSKGEQYIWLGPENKLGRCTQLRKEVMAIKTATQAYKPHVWAYLAYFKTVSAGAKKRSLPPKVKSEISKYFPKNVLNTVKYASSKHTWGGNAMTDCSTIYFSSKSGKGMVTAINKPEYLFDGGHGNALHLLLHEIGHVKQCIDWGGRLNYADKWFSQVPISVQAEIIENAGLPYAKMKAVHDRMPMEKQTENRANSIMSGLGYAKNGPEGWVKKSSLAKTPATPQAGVRAYQRSFPASGKVK